MKYIPVKHEYGGPDPGKPEPGIMFVFYLDGKPEMVEFLCPCGCGQHYPIHVVSDSKDKFPRWHYDEQKVSLSPSILHLSGCKSHFYITDGEVRWC